MANNRLYLHCAICGDEIGIAQQSVGSPYWSPPYVSAELYTAWLAEHTRCGEGTLTVRLTGENSRSLRLVTESANA